MTESGASTKFLANLSYMQNDQKGKLINFN